MKKHEFICKVTYFLFKIRLVLLTDTILNNRPLEIDICSVIFSVQFSTGMQLYQGNVCYSDSLNS